MELREGRAGEILADRASLRSRVALREMLFRATARMDQRNPAAY